MQLPTFAESNHPLVKSLFGQSDQELLTLFQRHPEEGKYFTAIFCRYSPIVFTLITHSAKSPVQAEYLFALTWRHIFYELRGLDLRRSADDDGNGSTLTLQNWLINITALYINQTELPTVESIPYSLQAASPPLWCYVQQALDSLPALHRLIVVMTETFHFSETRIAGYLQAEGEDIAPAQVRKLLIEASQILDAELPADIKVIYLQAKPKASTENDSSNSLLQA